MHTLRSGIVALLALVLWAPAARPDDFIGMVPEEGAVQVMLLRQKSVRDELKMKNDQARAIHNFGDQQWKKAQEIEKLAPDQRRARYDVLTRENEQFLNQSLDPNQRRRLDEVSLQIAGLLLATSPRVATQLRLTPQQQQELMRHQNEARNELNEAVRAKGKEGREERMKQLRETSRKRLLEVLTDEQEQKWKQMTGAAFDAKFKYEEDDSSASK